MYHQRLSDQAIINGFRMGDAGMYELMAYEDMDFSISDIMEQKRTTPEFITSLEPNEIFVFGSNLRGMHGGGAAYIAYRKFGAIMGQGVGLQGQSYAIPHPSVCGRVHRIRQAAHGTDVPRHSHRLRHRRIHR